MAELKGQLDGRDYPKSIKSMPHNVAGKVGKGTPMKGQMGNDSNSQDMRVTMSMNKSQLKGQLE